MMAVGVKLVAVDVSDGGVWTVVISSACAVSCGNSNSHRAKSAVINADLSINLFISLHPLVRRMSNRMIIPFY
jgi:hypothetical protein